jgi:hypothetical protein
MSSLGEATARPGDIRSTVPADRRRAGTGGAAPDVVRRAPVDVEPPVAGIRTRPAPRAPHGGGDQAVVRRSPVERVGVVPAGRPVAGGDQGTGRRSPVEPAGAAAGPRASRPVGVGSGRLTMPDRTSREGARSPREITAGDRPPPSVATVDHARAQPIPALARPSSSAPAAARQTVRTTGTPGVRARARRTSDLPVMGRAPVSIGRATDRSVSGGDAADGHPPASRTASGHSPAPGVGGQATDGVLAIQRAIEAASASAAATVPTNHGPGHDSHTVRRSSTSVPAIGAADSPASNGHGSHGRNGTGANSNGRRPGYGAGTDADAPNTTAVLDRVDEMMAHLEERILEELERRGGRFTGSF